MQMARKSNKMRKPKIALCRMFSGDYWEDSNNIGYESINMFLPDGQAGEKDPESYIYLPSFGDYNFKINEIKYVILTQHIAKRRKSGAIVKVIGMAEVKEETLKASYTAMYPQDNLCKNYKCIGGIKEFEKLQNIFSKGNNSDPSYHKAEILSKIHKEQIDKLKEVKYCGKSLEDIFKKNYLFGDLNILVTLKVKNLILPKQNIYLTNNWKVFSNFFYHGDKVIEVKASPSAQSQTTFIEYSDDIIQGIKCSDWEKAYELDINKFDVGFEPSFLTIIKKEYDELSYSNLFAYFLKNIDFYNHFFAALCDENSGQLFKMQIGTSSKLEVVREENHIDIIIKADNFIMVIENKIKSAINGHSEEDINGKKFKNQLVRYYKYVENKDKEKNKYYFIFAPDYNPVDKDNFGKSEAVEMKDVWRVIRYSKILEKCELFCGFKGTSDEWYYKEFKKALRVHTVSSLKNHYRDMQIKMKNLI